MGVEEKRDHKMKVIAYMELHCGTFSQPTSCMSDLTIHVHFAFTLSVIESLLSLHNPISIAIFTWVRRNVSLVLVALSPFPKEFPAEHPA